MATQKELDDTYMGVALLHSKMSKANRAKVGCCMVTPEFTLLCGFNGTPKGFDNVCEYENENAELVTHDYVVHAERNAIAAAVRTGVSLLNACAYVTLSPCVPCAVLMKQAGITRVVYKDKYRDESGIVMLQKLGIEVKQYENPIT